ncbi:MAG TPA: tripartite tricarboxylate transporter permease [Magnetospirillaceae bacterium]|nr:tripartite tricarboxylate transporter permease [Magnetospirillaceae bacterium]
MTGLLPDAFGVMIHALHLLLEPMRLLILVAGVLTGLAIGCVPGLGGVVGLAVLIPFTYGMDAYSAFALLLGMAAVTTSSDLIPAVLLGVPGTVGAAATVMDGHAMARKGEAGRAFGAGFAASLAGGIVGAVILAAAIPVLKPLMMAIGAPELLAFSLFGLSMVATLSGKAPLKGVVAAALGLMLSMIGAGMQTGVPRWTFDSLYLFDGLPLVPVTLGLFALPELADLAIERRSIAAAQPDRAKLGLAHQWQGLRDVVENWWLVLRCSVLGVALGVVPGIGSAVIDWIVYGYAQRSERDSTGFGSGDVRGVIAPESSNNAKEGGHLVPTIVFGVPAGTSMTLLLGAFLMHGLVPGPDMLTKHLDVTYSIIWSLTLAHVLGAIICVFGSSSLARLAALPHRVMLPVIIPVILVAAFEGSRDFGDLYSLLIFGVAGWVMKRLGWPRPPMVLGLVVGKIFERYLYISTEIYGGFGWMLRPVVVVVLMVIAWVLYRPMRQIAAQLVAEFRQLSWGRLRFGPATLVAVMAVAVAGAALATSAGWPAAERVVPRAACAVALTAALLNLVTELFGTAGQERPSGAESSRIVGIRALGVLAWLAGLIAGVALIGFIPAAMLFVLICMTLGFGESMRKALLCAGGIGMFFWAVFDRTLAVPWPPSLLGDYFPALRAATGLM